MTPNSEIIDDSDESAKSSPLEQSLSWWETRRILFNLIVGGVGLVGMLLFCSDFRIMDVIDICFFGVLMNIFYSVGFMLEALNKHYLKDRIKMEDWRLALFVLGTAASAILTFAGTFLFYSYLNTPF